ncbi:AraC family transcriptional regulator [Vibrio sp. Isolate23]|uniref:AraC family transcriptional regulator n=1 Tax=Vibrio sp. Isolate23 TaxID=2908533 RepID=UPI001EFDED48|nr:AraC family transcriptional regulator [Vibrio sp. Isolate23]MCG9683320.1 AraC family transcriptional regulator [Vibrio sp. Isolate23]
MDHLQRVRQLQFYLEENCSERLNLDKASKVANLSPFHLHRVFKVVTGETISEYIRRIRYEKAAQLLMFQSSSITAVALECGFSSSQAMAKSFKTYIGVTPTQIKQCQTMQEYSALMRNSKIGSKLRKNGNEVGASLRYSDFELKKQGNIDMKTVNLEKRTVAYVRIVGPYGENYEEAVEKLYLWAGAKGLQGECLFLYHDNPEITPADKCRTDIALQVPEGTTGGSGVAIEVIPAGSYAVLRKTVEDKQQYEKYWNQLIEEIIAKKFELDQRPCFELYHSYDEKTGRADVSFCEAIKI